MTHGFRPDATLERAIGLQKAGRLEDAERDYLEVLRHCPAHALANHNMGILKAQRGRPETGMPFFRAALQSDPGTEQHWLSYARALLADGRAQEAAALLAEARQHGFSGPAFAGMSAKIAAAQIDANFHFLRGNRRASEGAVAEAISAYRQAIHLKPDFPEAHFHLGSVLSENGAIAEGFAHFFRRAALVHDRPCIAAENEAPHKRKHDREQQEYLIAEGVIAGPNAVFHLEDGGRVEGHAVNPANSTPALSAHWRTALPQYVVIDDFLMPDALTKLRRYCAGSTIWRKVYDAGYIGATPEDGLACPLLAQLAEEIPATFPEIFHGHAFRYLGAFKYDSEFSTGTNIHADNSAINVNLYITPDEANLDPESGGMDIWDVAMPGDIDMRVYNGDEAAARAFLARSQARVTIVPHRANRCVIFKSDLFHKTSLCRFKEGYLNKRINVSLLFGQRGAATR